MSTIQINIPDCAVSDNNGRLDSANQTIVVDTSSCPVQPPGPQPMIDGGWVIVAGVIAAIFIVATAFVRFCAHENKPLKMRAQNDARKNELDAQIKMATAPKCQVCGHKPVLEES